MCGSKTPKTTTTTQINTPPAQVLQNYQEVYDAAKQVAGTPFQPYQGQMVAPLGDRQNAALDTIDNAQGMMLPFIGQAAGYANLGAQNINPMDFSNEAVGKYMSPYTDSVVNATMANLQEDNAQQQQQVMGNAISRGAWGGDRAGIAQAELARQQSLANGQTIANLRNQGYTQALGEFNTQQQTGLTADQNNAWRQGNAAYALGNLGQLAQSGVLGGAAAQLQGGTLEQQNQQQGINSAYQQYLSGQGYPFQTLGWLSNVAQGLGSQSGGSSSSTAPGPSQASQIAGGLTSGLGLLGATGAFGSAGWLAPAATSAASGIGSALGGLGAGLAALFADGGRVEFADGGPVNAYGASPDEVGGLKIRDSAPRGPLTRGIGIPNAPAPNGSKPSTVADQIRSGTDMLKQFRNQNGVTSTSSGAFNGGGGNATTGLADRNGPDGYAGGGFVDYAPGAGGIWRPAFADGGLPDDSAVPAPQAGLVPLPPPQEVPMRSVASVMDTPLLPSRADGPADRPVGFSGTVSVPDSYHQRTASRESGNDTTIKNPNSSARGVYQVTRGTWEQSMKDHPDAGLTWDGWSGASADARRQQEVEQRLRTQKHAGMLKDQGLEPTGANLYAAHFLGATGGPNFVVNAQRNPDAPAYSFAAPDQVKANQTVFFNKDGSPKSAGDVYAWMGGTGSTSGNSSAPAAASGSVAGVGAPKKSDPWGNQDLWMSVLAAGLGMMGGTSPFAGVNIGQGGLQGVKTWQDLQRQRREEANSQSEIDRRSAVTKNEGERLLLDAQRIKGDLDTHSKNAATQRMNVESEIQQRERTATQYVPGVGWVKKPVDAPAEGTIPQTVAPSNAPGQRAVPQPGAPQPAPAPTAGEAPAAPQAPTPVPIRAWRPTTEAPDGLVNRDKQMTIFQSPAVLKAEEARATKMIEDAAGREQGAGNTLFRLDEMDRQFKNLPTTGFLAPGSYATERGEWAKNLNTLLGREYFPANQVAAHEQLLKDRFRLGAELSRQIGGREPGFIVQQAVTANPGADNTAMGYKRITAGLREAAHYEQDRSRFMQSFMTKYGHLNGAEESFSRLNSPERYSQRAILSTVDPRDAEALTQNPALASRIDQKYGVGVSKLIMGAQ